jgi:hypothetical protein
MGNWARMPGKIFVSYRRDDVPGDARGVRDALAAKFGKSSMFMDVDNLFAGQRFDEQLAKALTACDVLLAIIGPRWMELLKAKSANGERDYVHEEICAGPETPHRRRSCPGGARGANAPTASIRGADRRHSRLGALPKA